MVDMILYCFPQSTCSQKVRLALWEKNIPFEERHVDHKNLEQLSEWYLKLNPNGVVPTLIDGDDVIIDSSVILEYLEEVYPDHPMSPNDPVGRAHMRKWLRYLEEVPTPAVRIPSFNNFIPNFKVFLAVKISQCSCFELAFTSFPVEFEVLHQLWTEVAESLFVGILGHVSAEDFEGFFPGPQ